MTSPFDIRHGWALYLHPAFKAPYDALVVDVQRLSESDPVGFATHPKAKLLKRITDLILDEIPSNPGAAHYRQGKTLGPLYKDWFRAKFLGRFRLFFKYNTNAKIIIFCWVNDENTLRKSGSDTDPYTVFAKMIRSGHPPNGWDQLLASVD